MTEIKSAIEHYRDVCVQMGQYPESDTYRYAVMAIRSLNAWEEVLQELENMRDIIWQDTDCAHRIVRTNAWDKIEILNKAIDIIKQKLEEIEE